MAPTITTLTTKKSTTGMTTLVTPTTSTILATRRRQPQFLITAPPTPRTSSRTITRGIDSCILHGASVWHWNSLKYFPIKSEHMKLCYMLILTSLISSLQKPVTVESHRLFRTQSGLETTSMNSEKSVIYAMTATREEEVQSASLMGSGLMYQLVQVSMYWLSLYLKKERNRSFLLCQIDGLFYKHTICVNRQVWLGFSEQNLHLVFRSCYWPIFLPLSKTNFWRRSTTPGKLCVISN